MYANYKHRAVFHYLTPWGPLDPKIWGGGGGGRNQQKVRFIITKIKKIHIFPKIGGGGGRPPCHPGSGPHVN